MWRKIKYFSEKSYGIVRQSQIFGQKGARERHRHRTDQEQSYRDQQKDRALRG